MGERGGVYRFSVGKPEGKRPLGRPRRRWEDNIKMDLRSVGWGGAVWIYLARDRDRWRALVNTALTRNSDLGIERPAKVACGGFWNVVVPGHLL
jgi:hypothetical protein